MYPWKSVYYSLHAWTLAIITRLHRKIRPEPSYVRGCHGGTDITIEWGRGEGDCGGHVGVHVYFTYRVSVNEWKRPPLRLANETVTSRRLTTCSVLPYGECTPHGTNPGAERISPAQCTRRGAANTGLETGLAAGITREHEGAVGRSSRRRPSVKLRLNSSVRQTRSFVYILATLLLVN